MASNNMKITVTSKAPDNLEGYFIAKIRKENLRDNLKELLMCAN